MGNHQERKQEVRNLLPLFFSVHLFLSVLFYLLENVFMYFSHYFIIIIMILMNVIFHVKITFLLLDSAQYFACWMLNLVFFTASMTASQRGCRFLFTPCWILKCNRLEAHNVCCCLLCCSPSKSQLPLTLFKWIILVCLKLIQWAIFRATGLHALRQTKGSWIQN